MKVTELLPQATYILVQKDCGLVPISFLYASGIVPVDENSQPMLRAPFTQIVASGANGVRFGHAIKTLLTRRSTTSTSYNKIKCTKGFAAGPINHKYLGCGQDWEVIIYLTVKVSKAQAPSLLIIGTNRVNLREKEFENRT